MADPKAYEPEKLTSGVTWKWKKTISDYPASEWTLTYYLRKSGATATSFSARGCELGLVLSWAGLQQALQQPPIIPTSFPCLHPVKLKVDAGR